MTVNPVIIGRAQLYLGDCRDILPTLEAGSVCLVAADLPYGMTDCEWDTIIDPAALWAEYGRLLLPNRAVILTASQPFTSELVMSNRKWFKHEWIWKKNAGSNFGTARFQPMKEHESALVFSNGRCPYFPIMQERAPSGAARVKTPVNFSLKAEGVYAKGGLAGERTAMFDELRYPSSVQPFNRERGLHPTQKPVALMEYLIRTYSQPGWTVLDNTMGSGTTGVAAVSTGRKFIGIEADQLHFATACKRIEDAQRQGDFLVGAAA